jgi:hypothetical protein
MLEDYEKNELKFLKQAYSYVVEINKTTDDVWELEVKEKEKCKYSVSIDGEQVYACSSAFGINCYLSGVQTGMSYKKCRTCKSRIQCELNKTQFGEKECIKLLRRIEYEYETEKAEQSKG